jgi:hypothetical protein
MNKNRNTLVSALRPCEARAGQKKRKKKVRVETDSVRDRTKESPLPFFQIHVKATKRLRSTPT